MCKAHCNGFDDEEQTDVGVIGLGSMGEGLALLFAQNGSRVACFDVKGDNVQKLLDDAERDTDVDEHLIHPYCSLGDLVSSFKRGKPRVIVFSLPHGSTADKVLDEILLDLDQGDIILDGGNEWWEETERRQGKCAPRGVKWIGCGVSGGYQSARRGPSMSPGGDRDAYAFVEPLLKKWAAKASNGDPCVRYIGPGGSGHYVKMVHNGIEQGILSAVCEAYGLLRTTLGLSNGAIADIFKAWNGTAELKNTFLVKTGEEMLRFTRGDGAKDSKGIVDDVEDKVVQDVDNTEGTGVWTFKELSQQHVGGPTIAAAHNLRVTSADKAQRVAVARNLKIPQPSTSSQIPESQNKDRIEMIRRATYGAIIASFVQGCNVIAHQSKMQNWGINIADCIAVWRSGCIIQSDHIADLLTPYYTSRPSDNAPNALLHPPVAYALGSTYQALKVVVTFGIDYDAVIPALSATLEYVKSVGGKNLPTNFEETEMDYFGHHNYDLKGEHHWNPKIGAHHTEWKPARSDVDSIMFDVVEKKDEARGSD